ncbi:hypothetical protein EDD86DRAFT_190509 [Gorgonomyces haynaldii]|nr:hypothetical protein EDD86DRAFT_190509 [Gorgonomyces haynaldii]
MLSEISGALGDMGTLLPILVSLTASKQISLPASLVFGGIYNILTGFYYDIPMAVQPMKSIASIALLSNMPREQVVSAGMSVSAFLLVLVLTRTLHLVQKWIPLCLVRGIQLGTGLGLFSSGIKSIQSSAGWNFTGFAWMNNYVIAMLSMLLVLVMYPAKRNYSALILFLFGVIASVIVIASAGTSVPFQVAFETPFVPSADDFYQGFIRAGLGQIPLTLLNSVIAVSMLADDLFPEKAPAAPTDSVAVSVGLMNLISGWFGSVPYCHGSGGLAGQYRFGARSGKSIIFLGTVKLLAGIFFGTSLAVVFKNIPSAVLGILLVVAGMQLTSITLDLGKFEESLEHRNAYMVMLLTGSTTVFFANDGIGFLTGAVAYIILNHVKL